MRTGFALAELFSQNLGGLGRTAKEPDLNDLGDSADMANVSRSGTIHSRLDSNHLGNPALST